MKVLLRKNVAKLGHIGEVVTVKPGYARNYLLPEGLAMMPTESNLRRIEAEKQKYLEELARQKADLEAKASAVNGKEVTIAARANEEGHLYGSVGPAQIVAALAEQGILVEPEYVVLPQAIRQLDKYDVQLDFGHEVTATIHLWVVPIREPVEGELPEAGLPETPTAPPEAPAAEAEPSPEG